MAKYSYRPISEAPKNGTPIIAVLALPELVQPCDHITPCEECLREVSE